MNINKTITMTINERIKHIVDECFNGNVSAFSRAIDVPQPTLKDIVGGKFSKPSYSVLEKIVNAESLKISSEWLLSEKGEMVRQDVKQSGWGNINTSSGNVSVEKIVQNDHSVNIALPEKGFQKIINSDGSETTIEAHSFDMDKIAQIEAENKKLREKLEHLDSVLHENSVLKDRIMELQTRLITLLSPKTND